MNRSDPDTLAELIADCAEIPRSLSMCHQELPPPRAATAWRVNEGCLAQVRGLDEFV